MLLLALVMLSIFPAEADLKEGFKSPIIAFEFAQSNSDITFLSGNSENSKRNRDAMRQGHQWDMVFPFAYAGYLLVLLLLAYKDGSTLALLGVPFAILIVPFDLYENFSLLIILDASQIGPVENGLFTKLFLATWLKWSAIAIAIGVLGTISLMRKYWISATIGIGTLIIAVTSFISNSAPQLVEAMGAMVSLFLLVSFISQINTARTVVCDTNSN